MTQRLTIEAVDPELRGRIEKFRRSQRPAGTIGHALTNTILKVLRFPIADGVTVRRVRQGNLDLRIYEPAKRVGRGALLWIHGGGYVIGDAKQDNPLCSGTAAELGIPVISANYRLAPRHHFPAALEDVRAAWDWVLANADELGSDVSRIAVGGESAGAGLAAALVQNVHDAGSLQPSAQWLFAPMLDDRTAAEVSLDEVDHFVWNNVTNRAAWTDYLGREPGAIELPEYAAPARRADLSGLPSAFIAVGSIELFYDEDVGYAKRLGDAGIPVELDVVAGGPHGFENWAHTSGLATALLQRARHWLSRFV